MAKKTKKVRKKVVKKHKGARRKTKVKESYKRGSLTEAINALFDKRGLDKVTFEEALAVAKKAMPNTKFNRAHYGWYRNAYRVEHM